MATSPPPHQASSETGSSFFTDLWLSIFTPGPTSSLLLATNISFAALQLLLAIMLFATRSIHFVILSLISAGLWCGVNWFVRESLASGASAGEKESRDDGQQEEMKGDGDAEGRVRRRTTKGRHKENDDMTGSMEGEKEDEEELRTSGEWDKVEEANVYKRT